MGKNENAIPKDIKFRFCYSATMEAVMSLHVIADPEIHRECSGWVMHIFETLTEQLKEEILDFGSRYGKWYYVLDLLGLIVEEEKNYQNDIDMMTGKIREMPLSDVIYFLAGLCETRLDISIEHFREIFSDAEKCKEELVQKKYALIEMENLHYMLQEPEKIRTRLIWILEEYWNQAFSKEWDSISSYEKDIISHEEMLLRHTSLEEYMGRFHADLIIKDGILSLNKIPGLSVNVNQITDICITPSIFGEGHLHGNIYQGTVNLVLNLNYRALQVSRDIPDDFFSILRALGDESRFKIIKVLKNGDATTKDISDILRLSPSTISAHLKVLREADLVDSHKVKKFVYYQLKTERLENLQDRLMTYLKY